MSDQPNTPPEEKPERKGDCLTPTTTIVILVITVIFMAGKWILT